MLVKKNLAWVVEEVLPVLKVVVKAAAQVKVTVITLTSY